MRTSAMVAALGTGVILVTALFTRGITVPMTLVPIGALLLLTAFGHVMGRACNRNAIDRAIGIALLVLNTGIVTAGIGLCMLQRDTKCGAVIALMLYGIPLVAFFAGAPAARAQPEHN